MQTMQAAVLVAPERFEVREVPLPPVGPDDVLVRVDRCGICGTDVHIFHGHYAADKIPFIPGHEFTGILERVGEGVNGLKPGLRVVADINIGCGHCYFCRRNEILNCAEMRQIGIHRDGAFAEYVSVPARQIIPAPDSVVPEVLALTEPVACVVRAARKAGAGFAQSVVVLGAGPIGNLHIQMVRLVGAAPVIAVELSPERAELARRSGADVVITDPADVRNVVHAHTGGRGADIVIESIGSPALYASAFNLIRPGGHVAAFGITGPDDTIPLRILDMVLRENSIKGSVAGMGEDMHDALALLTHGRFLVEPFTRRVVPLSDIQTAFESLGDNPEILKVQIRPGT
ncbi:zinc-dependent alcohol dehydrogenase [Acetobacter oeni]|uniref:Dehydrogenase n=1 Tax=Acetobacter oeni TaxID=304077 RepID=A0A511XM86_9PROT|nr:alcohol dehydrogenase catalytic domain-containing protein [Acetobacter oeni]MBB3884062.1 2-desacetyl-2-hydroxyethyl bacteriochlorophyllide A dehydrogenase [Acetobacter oeni]NHO19994.1 alcohol dehydrogenase catalytic domain-containing protein [Acetobacter oeni]GBR08524.1 threonine dehydrogenase [Acetobacter oeni LMG 21952]GEN64048.1 dehydrogenase [Acetobacter oeni]